MIPLPEPGDYKAAEGLWNARVSAIAGDTGERLVGEINTTTGEGDGYSDLRAAVGDLYDPAELMADMGTLLIDQCLVDMVATGDPRSAFATAIIQSVAIGALMERVRWSR